MDIITELEGLGIDTQDALRRFSGNSALYVKMLGKFVTASGDLKVMPYIDNEDYKTAENNAHTLKGVTGNLSLTPLYEAYTNIVNFLRTNEPQKAREILEKIIPVQADIVACIEKYSK